MSKYPLHAPDARGWDIHTLFWDEYSGTEKTVFLIKIANSAVKSGNLFDLRDAEAVLLPIFLSSAQFGILRQYGFRDFIPDTDRIISAFLKDMQKQFSARFVFACLNGIIQKIRQKCRKVDTSHPGKGNRLDFCPDGDSAASGKFQLLVQKI